ncbi:MAG: hypothetical protein JXB50_16955 [Spirochaetes bacterium]|nr:hypothetical protein [Spirochaetota bacterium]
MWPIGEYIIKCLIIGGIIIFILGGVCFYAGGKCISACKNYNIKIEKVQ